MKRRLKKENTEDDLNTRSLKRSKYDKKSEAHEKPLTFQLLDLKYVPDDHHQFYFKGRTNDNRGIMGVVEGYQHYFYLERQTKFKNNAQVEEFLCDVEKLLVGATKGFNVDNRYLVQQDNKIQKDKKDQKDSKESYKANTRWYSKYSIRDDCNEEPTVDEGMQNFWTKFELINDHYQTMAHYMPNDEFIQVVKVYVKYPYQAKVLSLFFESDIYANYIDGLNYGKSGKGVYEVRTFCATFDPELTAIIDHNITMGSWCTIKSYKHLVGNDRIGYNYYNVVCNIKDIESDELNLDPCNMRIMSFDGEMPSKPGRFPRPINEPVKKNKQFDTKRKGINNYDGSDNDDDTDLDDAAVDGENDMDPLDRDPIVILGTIIKESNVHSGTEFEKAVVFVYENKDAEPLLPVKEWIENKRKKDPKFESLWKFDRVEFRKFDSEVEMLFAFQDYVHESDLDVIMGHNIDRFDLPYIAKTIEFHSKWGELKGKMIAKRNGCMMFDVDGVIKVFNLGCLRKGYSKMKEDYKSKMQGIISHRVTTDFYTLADSYHIWINDGMEKPTNYTLNVIAMENLLYPNKNVDTCYERVKKKYEGEMVKDPGKRLFSELKYDDLVLLGASRIDELKDELQKARDTEVDKEKRAKMGFEMKKIDFDHNKGIEYWKNGGLDMLHFSLYCVIDCILPASMIQKKSKLTSNLLFTSMTGVGMLDILSSGQHRLVTSQIYALYKTHNNGIKLPYDRGTRHAHWPGVFDHPQGIHAGVMKNWARLQPYCGDGPQNQGGAVQEPAIYGIDQSTDPVFTIDAGSEYPCELQCRNLGPCTFLNRHLIAKYNIPRHHYSVNYLGDSKLNWCGEPMINELQADIIGCENTTLKVTYWYQNAESAIGVLVKDSFENRNAGKKAKKVWMGLLNYLNSMNSEEKKDLESLLKSVSDASENGSTHQDDKIKDFLLNCPKIMGDFKDVNTKKKTFDLLKSMTLKIKQFTKMSDLENLCLFQYDNSENYQLTVKRGMNSLYGVLMMEGSIFSCPETAATVTAGGREDIGTVRIMSERGTSTLAKRHMGYTKDETEPNKDLKPIGEDEDVYAGNLRFLQNECLSTMKHLFRSYEAFVAVYGDTDSVMCKCLNTSVVNKHQAFAVMKHSCSRINFKMYGMLRFNDEKIALITILYSAKIYDMMAYLSPHPDFPVKWIFSGFGKSDTIPFVKETLYECKQIVLKGLNSGFTTNEVVKQVCDKIAHNSVLFAMGRIPPAKLCMTKQIHKVIYQGKPPHHAEVASKMIKRGISVNIKDYITYTFVKTNNEQSGCVPEDLNYINSLPDPYAILDLKQIWDSCIIKKFKIFLRNLIAPVEDYPEIDPMAEKEVIKLQKSKQNEIKQIQENYIASGLFNVNGGIVSRLDKRDKELQKVRRFSHYYNHVESECSLCFKFYKKELRAHTTLEYEKEEEEKMEGSKKAECNPPRHSAHDGKLCPDCKEKIGGSNDNSNNKLTELIQNYESHANEYVKCWSKCLVCVELGETPNPGLITSCKASHCSNYKRKLSLESELVNDERILIELANFEGISW